MSTTITATTSISKSATPRMMATPRFSQESRIRLRLLNSLGIEPKQSIQKRIRQKATAELRPINYFKTVSAPFLQPLKDSISAPRATSTFSSSIFLDSQVSQTKALQSNRNKDQQNWNVRFDDDVLVVPIPSRHAYSDRMKKTIWRDAGELRDIVNRNRYEYTFEGWDSSMVLDDDDMYVDIATGEKVHPCWVENSGLGDTDEDSGEIENAIE